MTETRVVRWRRHGLAVLLSAVAGGLAVEARADTLIVPDQYPAVQAAIDAAASGDVVQVRPGTYVEALSIEGKSLVIEGLGGQPVIAPGSMAKGILARCDSLGLGNLAIVGARIGIIAKVRDLTLVGVDVSGCGKGAILKGERVAVSGSFTGSTSGTGLKAAGEHVSVGVIASGNAGVGAKVKSTGDSTTTLSGSTFDDNGKHGLILVYKKQLELSGTEASRNGAAGIVVKAKAVSSPILTDNRADDNGTYGFYLRGNIGSITEAVLLGWGNTATGNGVLDFFLQP